jgi:hypothetical protein
LQPLPSPLARSERTNLACEGHHPSSVPPRHQHCLELRTGASRLHRRTRLIQSDWPMSARQIMVEIDKNGCWKMRCGPEICNLATSANQSVSWPNSVPYPQHGGWRIQQETCPSC